MKLVKPSYEIIEQGPGLQGIYDIIERCGKTSYKSEVKGGEDAKRFVEARSKEGHGAVLEFGTVYLAFNPGAPTTSLQGSGDDETKSYMKSEGENVEYFEWSKIINFYRYNKYSKVTFGDGKWYVTTNYRVLVENNRLDDLKYQCEPTEYHEKRYCVKFITDIGVGREFLRHRTMSMVQESTRYVSSISKNNIKEFDFRKEDDIANAYEQGYSMKTISDASDYTEWEVRKILLSHDVKIRGLNNKGERDESFFNIIDSPEKAYLLGIIQTDGNIRLTESSASVTVTQHKDYSWYLDDMLHLLSDYVSKTSDKNCNQLTIGSKKIAKRLSELGIVPNKSKTQTDENIDTLWSAIPDHYKCDFIRGLIDGDGCVRYFVQKKGVNESCHINLCSTQKHLLDLVANWLGENFDYKPRVFFDKIVYRIIITDYKKSIEIGKTLYRNFKYPFGHPKKASTWIKRLNEKYDFSSYKDEKFQVIIPPYLNESPEAAFACVRAWDVSEDAYKTLRLNGWLAQQARGVLPLATKTEFVLCGFKDAWIHFFRLRSDIAATGKPHPQALEIATPLRDEFIKRQYITEEDLKHNTIAGFDVCATDNNLKP